MGNATIFLLVFSLGAVCVLLGFYLVLKGIGASDSESRIKLLGLEITTSRVGPGVLFAVFGTVLIIAALTRGTPSSETEVPIKETGDPSGPQRPTDPGSQEPSPVEPPSANPSTLSAPPTPRPTAEARRAAEERLLRRAIADMANGLCTAERLEPLLKADCEGGIGRAQPVLAAMGEITQVTFVQALPDGLNQFRVDHVNGSLVWRVMLSGSRKLQIMVTP